MNRTLGSTLAARGGSAPRRERKDPLSSRYDFRHGLLAPEQQAAEQARQPGGHASRGACEHKEPPEATRDGTVRSDD